MGVIASEKSFLNIVVSVLMRCVKELAVIYQEVFKSWPGIDVVQPDWEIALKSGQIRISYKVPLPDAIQIATAIVNKADAFITNDERLKKVKKPKILLLADYV